MLLDDGFQISDAVALDGGVYQTTLIDGTGQEVGTITRLSDGTTTAAGPGLDSGNDYDWSNLLGKVTGFLDNVANTARGAANEATRISRGIQGAAAGANAGYTAPIDWKPWAVAAGAVIVAGVAIASASSSSSRRRR